MEDACLLGIDVGTTGTKALLIDVQGKTVACAVHEYPLLTPHPGWAEQDPNRWWTATTDVIRRVIKAAGGSASRIAAVGLTGQMHGATLLDRAGEVLRPAILWNDQRTARECNEIAERVGADRVLQLTGNPVLTGFTAPKLLWTRRHEPEIYAKIAAVLLPKDYVRYRLTGQRRSDVSDASGTALFNVADRQWSDEMLDAVGVPREWLPEVAESPEVTAQVSKSAAEETGLLAGTPVVAGAGDQAAQAVGTGIVEEGIVSVTIGTSGVVFAASDRYLVEPQGKLHAFCHAVPGMWHLMGVMLSAGGSFRWYRDTLGDDECGRATAEHRDPYDVLTESAACAPAGCEGLIFLPYLTGERTPHADPDARGVFFGLSLGHGKEHLTRAVMEGVAYGLRDSLELIGGLRLEMREVRVSGGGARSRLWRQILADVFDAPIVTMDVSEGAAFGAALLAGVGGGVFDSIGHACGAVLHATGRLEPGPDVDTYRKHYSRYRALYPALASEFHRMADTMSSGD
ncbi:MAG: xylulokinase [Planctomycetes bacterium]|nr:xylulokinase [Planctomycetota bacterium]